MEEELFDKIKKFRRMVGYMYLECSKCGKEIKKGDYFVAMGKLPSHWRGSLVRLDAALREEMDKIYCKSCFEEKFTNREDVELIK